MQLLWGPEGLEFGFGVQEPKESETHTTIYYTILYYTIPYCTILYCTVLYYTIIEIIEVSMFQLLVGFKCPEPQRAGGWTRPTRPGVTYAELGTLKGLGFRV